MNAELGRRPFLATVATGIVGSVLSTPGAAATGRTHSVAVGSGWPAHRYDGGNTATASDVRLDGPLEETWQRETDDEPTAPVRAGGRLFHGTAGGELVARDSVDGETLWRVDTDDGEEVIPTVLSDTVITAGDRLVARDVEDGSEVWATDISGSGVGYAVPHAGGLYVTNTGRGMYAFETGTGDRIWTHASRGALAVPMAVDDGTGFVADDEGFLYRVDDGDRTWRTDLGTPLEVTPVAVDGAVYVPGEDGILHVVSQETGGETWTVEVAGTMDLPLAVSGRICLAGDSGGRINAIDTALQQPTWFFDVDGRIFAPPIVIQETCVVGTSEGDVIGLDIHSGETVWEQSLLDEAIVGLCGGPDQIHVTGEDGGVGGAYVSGALTARQTIRELEDGIERASENGIPTSGPRSRLAAASDALREFSYAEAANEADDGMLELTSTVQTVESLREEIEAIDEEATELNETTPVDASEVIDLVAEAEAALDSGDIDAAREYTERADERLSAVAGEYRDASAAIEELESTIGEARDADVVVGEAPERVETARETLEAGDAERAEEIASEETARLNERIQTAADARARIDELESAIARAEDDGIRIEEGRSLLTAAETHLADDEYDAALARANEGIAAVEETVATAEQAADLIAECEAFDPVQPGAKALAEQQGTDALIESARDAHESGDYDSALARAQDARATQRRSRWAVDGTIGVTAIGGVLAYRYGSLDRPVELINEHTDFGKVEDEAGSDERER